MAHDIPLTRRIKEIIISACRLKTVSVDDIDDDLILFHPAGRLGLDSIDALEFVVALQKEFGVRIDDQNVSRAVLQSVRTVADFIERSGPHDRAPSPSP